MANSRKEKGIFHAWMRSFFMGTWHAFSFRSWTSLPQKFIHAATKKNFLYCAKVGIASILAYVAAELLQFEYSLWAPMATIMVMQVHMSSSLELSLLRFFGTAFGAFLGSSVTVLLPAHVEGRILGIALIVPLCTFLEFWDERFRTAGVSALFILLLGATQESETFMFAANRVLEMGLGIFSALVVSLLLWPASAAAQVEQIAYTHFEKTAHIIQHLTHDFIHQERKVSHRALFKLLNEISNNTQKFYQVRNYELVHIYREYPLLPHSVRLMDELRMYLSAMMDSLDTEGGVEVGEDVAKIVQEVSDALCETLRWLAQKESNTSPRPLYPLVEDRAIRFATVRDEGLFRKYSAEKVVAIFAFYNGLNHAAQAVALLQGRVLQNGEGMGYTYYNPK